MIATKERLIDLLFDLHQDLDSRIKGICSGRPWGEMSHDEKLMVQVLGDYRDAMEKRMSEYNDFEEYVKELNR